MPVLLASDTWGVWPDLYVPPLVLDELLQRQILLIIEGRDGFGRNLADVSLADHRDYERVMIERGLALPYKERDQSWRK